MKKNIFLLIVFFLALFTIGHYISRNTEIKKTIQEYENIQYLAYQLEVVVQQQHVMITSMQREVNNDKFLNSNNQFIRQFEYFVKETQKIEDIELQKIIFDITQKNYSLEYIYEDMKSDYAVIKNSRMWLVKSYRKYLSALGNTPKDKLFLEYVFELINANSSYPSVEFKYLNLDRYNNKILNTHLRIIHKKRDNLIVLRRDLSLNDLTQDFEKIILLSLKRLNKLQAELNSIILMLLISSIFLLLFGLVVYIREILISRETRRLKNDLQQFVDALNASAIVSKTDLKGAITYVNDKFCEVSGYKKEELIGQPHNIIRHPDMSASVFKELWESITNKKIFKGIIKNKTKYNEVYFVDSVIVPLLDVDGEPQEYLAVRYEVTDLIQSRDAALLAEKAKDKFLSNMSHELRTPLNSINGFSTLLMRLITDTKQRDYLQNILDSSQNLIGLINDILDLSKLQSGKFSLDYHDFILSEKLDLFLERFNSLLSSSELRMQRNFDIDESTVLHGDWLRISQIITNLISNAIKFSPKNSIIELDIFYNKEKLNIIISDSGIGISKELQEKIFKPFEQADSSTTRHYGGTGLGLSIVLSLVQQMNATLELSSKEGEGSTFKVSIPLQESRALDFEKPKQEDENLEQLQGHLLIAEDNKTNQMLVSILIQEFGLTCTIANDGIEAVDIFAKEKFDLVLMDENMPNMNGIEAMKQIYKTHGTTVPIIALTANAMIGDREKFIQAGMSDYIAKPIDDKELYRVIKKYLKP